jgi:hypothetical protein
VPDNTIVGRKYRLRVIHDPDTPREVYVYGVGETADGRLVWVLLEKPKRWVSFLYPRSLDGNEITPDHAERITGLDYPACMDRLRELVHESE